MSSDFVFVEIVPNSDHPIADGITLNRLNKEWNAVKIDIKEPENQIKDSSIAVWDKLLSIYNELEQIDKDSATNFSQNCVNDVKQMLQDNQYHQSKELIYSFIISFMKIKNCTFLDIDKNCSISIINSLLDSYKDIQPDFIDDFLNVLKANEIEDEQGKLPFYIFLIKSYTRNDNIGEKVRSILIQIISEQKHNLKYLLNVLLDDIVELFCLFSDLSPTIFDNSHPLTLCRFIDTVFSLIENGYHNELIDKYTLNLQKKLIENLDEFPPLIQFETITFFLKSIHHIKTTSIFIQYITKNDSVFTRNIHSWLKKWTMKTLFLFSTMIDLRSSALFKAFFYIDDENSTQLFSFPDYSSDLIQKVERRPLTILSIDDFSVYQTINTELPTASDHVVSILQLISSLFSQFWILPFQTVESLLEVIEKVASIGNESAKAFCFTPGKGIYEQTQILLKEANDEDKERKNLLANFIITMKEILRNLEI